ncbi:MAG: 30S ribosomal protein S8 [Candidatus Spechtbacterales bacterium]|nr:30S ribosomal protein S8 [Candidatus Spechtbacterales bacterium]
MDPIADMLTIIRNGQAVGRDTVKISYSNIKFNLAKIFEREGFIQKAEKKGSSQKPVLILTLKYMEDRPKITALKRVSKPGQRIYKKHNEINKIKGGYGESIISTPKGLMTGEEARKNKVGGEYICEIW